MNWPVAHRIAHLAGGLRAVNPDQSKNIIISPTLPERSATLTINEYKELTSVLQSAGLKIIGVEFVESNMQVDGLHPNTWRPFYAHMNGWPVQLAEDVWGNLSQAAFKQDDFSFVEIARKIEFQITSCCWELKRISDAYEQELQSFCRTHEFKDGLRFETVNTKFIYMGLHAFFSAIGSLRDYLAEYTARYLLKDVLPEGLVIRKMSSLRSELRKSGDKGNQISKEILAITDHENEHGWLAKISDYRDLVVHYIPISHATHRGFLFQKLVSACDQELPSIFFPLPRDPYALRQQRSKGSLHDSVKEWMTSSVNFELVAEDQDALDCAHFALGLLVRLSLQLAGYSPYKPERLTLTEADLKGPIIKTTYPPSRKSSSV